MKAIAALLVGSLLSWVIVVSALGQQSSVLWSWDQPTGATKYGAWDPKLRLFVACKDPRVYHVPPGVSPRPQPGKTCGGGPPPHIYGYFQTAGNLYTAARHSGVTASKSAFFNYLQSPDGLKYLNAANLNDTAKMTTTLKASGLQGTVPPR
jgi:hypothetical protein